MCNGIFVNLHSSCLIYNLQMSPTHVNISKRYILQQATNTLKLQITDHDILDIGEHGLIASLSINLPPHRGWAAT